MNIILLVIDMNYFSGRMDEMMRGQKGWRELAVLGDKLNKFSGMIEGLIWSPRGSDVNDRGDDWAFEEVGELRQLYNLLVTLQLIHYNNIFLGDVFAALR